MAHRKIISFGVCKLFLRLLSLSVILVLLAQSWVSPVYAAANVAPTLDRISDQTILEDASPSSVLLTGISAGAGDVEQTLTISASSSDPSILPHPSIEYKNPEATGTLSLTPVQNMSGTVKVTVTVRDNGGTAEGGIDVVSQTFQVTITPVNDPPVVSTVNKRGIRGNPLAFSTQDFLTHYSDVENHPLSSIKIVSLPNTGTLKLDSAVIAVNTEIPANQLDILKFVPSSGWYGETSFSWVASDSIDYSVSPAAVEITYPSPMYLPIIFKPIPPPSAFNKTSPLTGATGQPINLVLDWQDAAGAVVYEYCVDSVINNTCNGTWSKTGTISQASPSGLNYSTKYEWHSRASNASGTTYSNGSPTAYFTFTTLTPPWVTAFTENFEGAFPGAWHLESYRYSNGQSYNVTDQYSWGKRNCQKASGSYGGWAVGGGSVGSGMYCNGGYPVNIKTWMVYGPFNLSQVKDGRISIKLWYDIEDRYDYLAWGVSRNEKDFYGRRFTGDSNGWITDTIDLKNVNTLGNVTGASQIWIGIWFTSDGSTTYEGAAVDNLVLSTCAASSGCTGSPASSALSELPDNLQVMPASESLITSGLQPASELPGNLIYPLSLSWDIKNEQ